MSRAQAGAARVPTTDAFVSPVRATEAPRLQLVEAPRYSRSRVPFVLLCIGILAAALLGTLVLNTAMANGSYEAQTLQRELAREAEVGDNLRAALDEKKSPQALAARATELGMVRFYNPGTLRLADQTVHGGAAPAGDAP